MIPDAMLEEARRLDFPLIEIPVRYPLSKICKVVFERLSGGGEEKADRFASLYHSISESMLEPDGVERMLSVLGDYIGNSVLLMGGRWELLGYAESGEGLQPSALLTLQKGAVILPEELTGNMPSDFARYTKAIKRVYSHGRNGRFAGCFRFPAEMSCLAIWWYGKPGTKCSPPIIWRWRLRFPHWRWSVTVTVSWRKSECISGRISLMTC